LASSSWSDSRRSGMNRASLPRGFRQTRASRGAKPKCRLEVFGDNERVLKQQYRCSVRLEEVEQPEPGYTCPFDTRHNDRRAVPFGETLALNSRRIRTLSAQSRLVTWYEQSACPPSRSRANRVSNTSTLLIWNRSAMTPTQALWVIHEITQLKSRYCRFLDMKDWDSFSDLFTEDCVHYVSAESPQPAQTNDEYLQNLRTQLSQRLTIHHAHMPEITLLSETEAEGIWATANSSRATASSAQPTTTYGHYFETYRKCADGRWRISSKRNVRLWHD
jgi:hypothetical protein